MVLYGVVSNTSIGYLFMGGVIPGLLLAVAQMGVVAVIATTPQLPDRAAADAAAGGRAPSTALPALLLPVIMLGGIYSRRGDADRGGGGRRLLRAAAGLLLVPHR